VRPRFALFALALAGPLGLWACQSSGGGAAEAPAFLNMAPGVAYVGDAACAPCHEDAYAGYQAHGMANSFYRMGPEHAVEDFSGVVVPHERSGYFYTAYREGDRFVQEEFRLGPDGQKTHRLARAMDYVVGSGSAARTYLTEVAGWLYELPLTWYTQADSGRGRWDLSPGYAESGRRFSRRVPSRCMACHNGTSEPVPHLEGAYARLADGIGCEQCHGPGALHVEARTVDPEPADSVDRTIVNPAHLPLDRRLDVCQQCHTHGAVSLLRDGAQPFGFRPGQALQDHVAIFAAEQGSPDRISVISHADRMRQSPCFVASGTMDCVTCHDPHEGFRDAGPAYFNRTCLSCHPAAPLQQAMPTPALRAQHASTAPCFGCHMPKVEAEDAPHSSFTDHFIRVVRDDRLEGTTAIEGDEGGERAATLTPYFEKDAEGPDAKAYEGMAYVVYGRTRGDENAVQRGVGLLAEAVEERPDFGEAQYLLGFARLQLGQVAAAIAPLEAAVRLGPDVPERLNTLAQAYERAGGDAAVIVDLYRRALQVQPRDADVRVNYGRFLETQGQLAAATAEYARAAQDNPWLTEAHFNLGTARLRAGQTAEAEAALEEAVRLQPDHVEALMNLGVLRAQRGELEAALVLFRRAVESAPRNADALANLALTLAQLGRVEEARHYAQEALALQPGHPTAQQVLGAIGA
jgi:Tfp pilus assembly protein PilF